jgi:hypothetical protein
VTPGFKLSLNDFAVAEVFEVPLFILDVNARQPIIALDDKGGEHNFQQLSYQDKIIWAAAASILHNLHDKLRTSRHRRRLVC